MNLVLKLSTLAMHGVVDGASKAAGLSQAKEAVDRIVKILNEHFTDHSQRLTAALRSANNRAWKALELSLAGDSLWERCKAFTERAEDKALAGRVREFLDKAKFSVSSAEQVDRQKCLQELRAARTAGVLTNGVLNPQELAEQSAAFARYSDPQKLIDGEGRVIEEMARELKQAGYGNLAVLMTQRPSDGRPLLVIAARYFFRLAVEEDAKLFQGLAFAQLEQLGKEQEEGFASLHTLMSQQGERLEEMLADVQTVVIETHSAVLDLQGQIEGQSGQLKEIGTAVQKLLEQHQLHRREVRPGDSLSIRNDNERQLVKQLVARYRALPEEDRRQMPALLNGIGRLEVVAGDFDAARKDFAAVATLVQDNKVQAEAHFNAYQACLERNDWSAAIQEFIKAVKLDAKRFASFPVGKYQPQRILGAGGFGVAFLCKHKYMDAQVVVKTLMLEDLGRDADKVFMEAQVLRQLDHPAIIRISDCGYVDATNRGRPFLVMDYFEGGTLEEHVKKHGPLSVGDLLAVMRPVAEGLQAAHGKGILHRDIKPANLLVRKEGSEWQAKVIDFGLAMRQKVVKTSMNASTTKRTKTLVGGSIAGTLDYAAPEQMGKREDAVGPYSDVYGWAKTCCYVLFQTTQPLFTHWQSIPLPLSRLLERCLCEDPTRRPQNFAEVLASLGEVNATSGQKTRQAAAASTFDFVESAEGTVKRKSSRSPRRKRERSKLPLLIGGVAMVLLAAVLLFTIILRSKTKAGMLVVEVDQPGAEVLIDGKQYTITQPGDREPIQIEVQEGERNLKVIKGGFETFTRESKVKSGGKETVLVRLAPTREVHNNLATRAPSKRSPTDEPSTNPTPLPTGPRQNQEKENWELLFNGKDLAGWKVFSGGTGNWSVRGGVLTVGHGHGPLRTEREDFTDFHLRMEVKINDGGNSGLFFRGSGSNLSRSTRYEAQINSTSDDPKRTGSLFILGLLDGTVTDWTIQDMLVPPDTWFTYEVIAQGNRIILKVNGKITVDMHDARNVSRGGWFALQEGTPNTMAYFRKIEMRELPSTGRQENAVGDRTDTYAAGEIDLLARLDLKQHVVSGEWTFDGGVLRARAQKNGREAAITLPYRPSGAYLLTIVATREKFGGIIVPIVFRGRQFGAYLSGGWKGSFVPEIGEMTREKIDFFPTLNKTTITCTVNKNGAIIESSAGARLVSTVSYHTVKGRPYDIPDERALYLKVWEEYNIHSIRLRPLDGNHNKSAEQSAKGVSLNRSPDRLVAEEVLRLGGTLSVNVNDSSEDVTVKSADALPQKPFQLTLISLNGKKHVTDADVVKFRGLQGLSSIRTLDLGGTSISDAAMPVACSLTSLRELLIAGTRISDSGLQELNKLPNLAKLSLVGTNVSDRGMIYIGKLTKLEKLHMGFLQISDSGIGKLSGLTNLKYLGLMDNFKVTDAGIVRLRRLVNLEDMNLHGTKVTDQTVKRLFPKCKINR